MATLMWKTARGWSGSATAAVLIFCHAAGGRDDAQARQIAIDGTDIIVRQWSGGETPAQYAISFDGATFSEPLATSYEIKLLHGSFDPLAEGGPPAVEEGFTAGGDTNLYLVQFITQPLEAYRQAIRDLGGTVHYYIPNHCHIVKMPPAVRDDVAALPFVRWVGPYHPAYRLEQHVLQNMERADTLFANQRYNIMVCAPGSSQLTDVADRIVAMGGENVRSDVSRILVRATLTPDQLVKAVRSDEVAYIDRWMPGGLDMDIVRQIGGADFLENTLGFSGQGVRGELMDDGYFAGHGDFQSHPAIMHTPWPLTPNWHGTCTMGVLFGDGTGNHQARGLLPGAQPIWAAYWPFVQGGANRFDHTAELVDPNGPYRAVFQSNSWGHARTTVYTTISAEMDDILFTHDIVLTNSLGNAGNQMGRQEAWAKNALAIGAVVHRNTLTHDDDCWNCDLPTPPPGVILDDPASHGPANDGRIKPDLIHFYDRTLTTWNSCPTCYGEFLGTSCSSPLTAGHFGLLFQMWHEQVFPGFGGGSDVFDSRPHMSTARALMINCAYRYDWSHPGPNADIDRFRQGWGMPDLLLLHEMRNKMMIIDESRLLTNMESAFYDVTVLEGEPMLRATLVYPDPMGLPSAAQHRVNDLSLKVTSPSGELYWGNHGLLDGNVSTPGGFPDDLNVIENVFVENPEAGTWTVEVLAHEVNEDGHVETSEIDVDFALVVSGIAICPGDINGDGTVDDLDLAALLAAWGATSGPEDINGDGVVDVRDLLMLFANWGDCPGDALGACCTPDGGCADTSVHLCDALAGDWYEGEACATFTCPALPTGACCTPDGGCQDTIAFDCAALNGDWYEGETCATFTCPTLPVGACCFYPSGDCQDLTEWACQQADGTWEGAGSECATTVCPVPIQGDVIEDPLIIDQFPYSTTGSTVDFVNDYDEVCPYAGSTAPDVVYAFTPQVDMTINISLCANSAYDTKLYVYENAAGNLVACNDDACDTPTMPYPYVSKLGGVPLFAGNTYYIIIDGFGTFAGAYTLDIF